MNSVHTLANQFVQAALNIHLVFEATCSKRFEHQQETIIALKTMRYENSLDSIRNSTVKPQYMSITGYTVIKYLSNRSDRQLRFW